MDKRRLRALLATGILVALVALALSCTSESSKASSAPRATNLHGKIVFIREGKYKGKEIPVTVFTAAANGTHVRWISDIGESPRFSPDGTKIMMALPTSDDQRITAGIIHSDGSHLQRIPLRDPTLNLGVGAWSPDGKQMALEGWDDSNAARNGVYIVGVPMERVSPA
jgi:hypothetical protein